MKDIHEFTLVLDGVDETTQGLEDTLFEAGCDDALINFRNGTVYLDFEREQDSLENAVLSAIRAVEGCGLGAKVIRILPDDLVSISDIAKRLDKDRQLVSLWVKGERRQKGLAFPPPVLKLSEKSPMWRWYSVVKWLNDQNIIQDNEIVERAKFVENINAVLEERDPEIKKYRHCILDKLERLQSSRTKGGSQSH
ncbi:MAG: hypothetical protein U1E78_01680 [Gammaproteobacteria bacterium]